MEYSLYQMHDRVDWTIQFLEHYRRFPCLWKKSSSEFKNRQKREEAELQLLPLIGINDVKVLRAKIRSLRCTYNQEVAKIKKSMESETGQIYEPKLAWFLIADSFLSENLEDYVEPTRSINSYQNNTKNEESFIDESNEEEIANIDDPITDIDNNNISNEVSPKKKIKNSPILLKSTLKSPRLRLLRKKVPQPYSVYKTIKQITPQHQIQQQPIQIPLVPINEFNNFGQHVATQLKCLPIEDALTLVGDIQSLITTARLRCLRAKTNQTKTG